MVGGFGGKVGRVRGGDRVLTHRLSNGFQRPPTPWLCAARGLIRSDGSARLDSVKAAPLLSGSDMDSHPPPSFSPSLSLHHRTPTAKAASPCHNHLTGKCWERTRQREKGKNERIIQADLRLRTQPKNSAQGDTWKADVQRSGCCGVLVSCLCVLVYQIDCVCLMEPLRQLGKPIVFI